MKEDSKLKESKVQVETDAGDSKGQVGGEADETKVQVEEEAVKSKVQVEEDLENQRQNVRLVSYVFNFFLIVILLQTCWCW